MAGLLRSVLVWMVCITLAVYLLNPGGGVLEILPDNIPFVGNLDEFIASLILISGLRYFRLDVARFFERSPGE